MKRLCFGWVRQHLLSALFRRHPLNNPDRLRVRASRLLDQRPQRCCRHLGGTQKHDGFPLRLNRTEPSSW